MFIKISGTKIGFYTQSEFVVNTDQIISIAILGDSRILYLHGDEKGIMLENEDFNRLYTVLDVKDCTI